MASRVRSRKWRHRFLARGARGSSSAGSPSSPRRAAARLGRAPGLSSCWRLFAASLGSAHLGASRSRLRLPYRAAQQRIRRHAALAVAAFLTRPCTFVRSPVVRERGPGLEASGSRFPRRRADVATLQQSRRRLRREARAPPNNALQRTRRQSLRSFLLAAELDIVRRLKDKMNRASWLSLAWHSWALGIGYGLAVPRIGPLIGQPDRNGLTRGGSSPSAPPGSAQPLSGFGRSRNPYSALRFQRSACLHESRCH